MSGTPGRPQGKSFAAVVWFPLFFATAFALMFLSAFASPAPRDMSLGVIGTDSQVATVHGAVRQAAGDGVEIRRLSDRDEAERLVRRGELAGVYVATDPRNPILVVASASSAIRADYLREAVGREAAQQIGGTPATSVDLVPAAKGDVSGVGLFFYAMPLLLVGMITSIVLLQAVTWTARKKAAAIAATGASASLIAYTVAVSMDVLPAEPILIIYAFVLTQAIGWLTTAVALLAKHHFMPVAMTFVLILGIPTAGGSVPSDMLPAALGVLHKVLPFAQFIDLARSAAYFDGHGTVRPLLTLLGWTSAAATLFAYAARRAKRPAPSPGA
jgi:hypothetical protein